MCRYVDYEIGVDVIWAVPKGTSEKIIDYYKEDFPVATTQDGRAPMSQVGAMIGHLRRL